MCISDKKSLISWSRVRFMDRNRSKIRMALTFDVLKKNLSLFRYGKLSVFYVLKVSVK
jgi:hypothetical protein